jgi:hypothetical protein
MPRRPVSKPSAALVALVLLGVSACSRSSPAPRAWQLPASEAARSVYGSWIVVETRAGPMVSGELLAAENDFLHVAGASEIIRVRVDDVARVRLVKFQGDIDRKLFLGIVGTLSTVSHGFFLVFSAPFWMISTTIATRTESSAGVLDASALDLDVLQQFSRFPQGLPPGFGHRAGEQDGPCYGNQTCDRGLRCDQSVCIPDPTQGRDEGACYPDASCEPGLVCDPARNRCSPPPAAGSPGAACYANLTCDEPARCEDGVCVAPQ